MLSLVVDTEAAWGGVMLRFCLLTEDLATVWEIGNELEETAFCQPPIMGLVGITAQSVL